MNAVVLTSILNSENLPSIPAVAFRVLEVCREEDADLQDVADVITKDPALTAKMLKVANSSLFGMSRRIGSIQQAMVVLGMRTVKVLALGFSLVEGVGRSVKGNFDYPLFWRRSLTTAASARQIAEAVGGLRRDEAFVGGLLCDIGMIAAVRHPERIYDPVLERYAENGGRIQEIEQAVLGTTHAQLSAMMLGNWSMPETLCHAVSAHHGEGFDELEDGPRRLAAALWAASEIAGLFCGDVKAVECDSIKDHVVTLTGIDRTALEEVLEILNADVREAADMFSVNINDELSYRGIRETAMMQLAALSMEAEQERAFAESRVREARSQLQTLCQLNESLMEKASRDKLTGIANRQAFDERLEAAIADARARKCDLGLILLDLDHFKHLNDTFGHQAGDAALALVGKCLKKVTDNVSFAARYGGEEFAVIVNKVSARALRELAEDIRKSISRVKFNYNSTDLGLTASLGAAHVSFGEEQIDARELIRRADQCLYDAKKEGRNRVEIRF